MQKVCATFLLVAALVANHEALPQNKWSRPIPSDQGQLTRERRQFPFGEWIPLNKPCPTCRPLIDPLDVAQRGTDIGLTPPRPPTVTRQVHGEGNFFPQDESSILSVPPPPPGTPLRHGSNGNFQNFRFHGFQQQFNNHVPLPTQQGFSQSQQVQFLPQPFVANQNVLVNSNQQSISALNNQNAIFGQENQGKQILNSGKVNNFNVDLKKQQLSENVVLQQNHSGRKLPFSSNSVPFTTQQQQQIRQQTFIQQPQQQTFVQHHQQQQGFAQQHQQQAFLQPQQEALIQQRPIQQQQSLNFDSILTPPPASNSTTKDIVIPGLDKEEVQLLYVPVETLKHRGTLQQQQHVLTQQQQQSFQFPTRQIPQQQQRQPAIGVHPTVAPSTTTSTTKLLPGSFVASQRETLSTVKVSSPQPFSTASTPATVFFQSLPLQQTPQPFVSATPIISTPAPFVTPSTFATKSPLFSQTFSTLSPTTLSHFPTIQNSVHFKQLEGQFGTTPKTLISEEGLREEIITGKPQFEGLPVHGLPFTQDQSHVILTTGHQSERNPIQTTTQIQTNLPEQQFQSHGLLLKSQQEQQLLLQQQKEKELKEEYLLKQRHQKELELQRQKELEQQAFLRKQKKQKELEEQERQKQIEQEQRRQKELEEQRLLQQQRQKELEEQRLLQQRQRELEHQKFLQQRQKELEEQKLLEEERQRKIELEQKRQRELEEQRLLQQRQKELEEQRLLQQRQREQEQQRQKEIERERYLQQQKQKEIEQERYLQEQRQQEMEKQLKINRLKELDERRLLQQRQKEEEEQRLLLLQQQKEFDEQRLRQEQQHRIRQQQEEQQHQQLQQNLQKQNQESAQKAQNLQFTQQQELNQHVTEHSNRHVFSETDDSNFISQAEKETDPESLIPHQPPLSVFYNGGSEAQPKIVDVLRELRSAQTITVLDQYFEKMPKVFVGPAGLQPPLGYGKFELPYLSNIDNSVEVKIDKIPFFVAPLNFVPPPGYSKIPFPSPHVGSVVVSSESNPAMHLKATESSPTVEENEGNTKNYAAVGPELPGLINGLQKEIITTTIRPTTSSLPQTTAQLRNRRPNNNLYRSRKPVPKTRSTTTPKPEEITEKAQKEDSEGGLRRPFNRFLKRRRPTTTTTTTTTEAPQEKDSDSRQNYFQNQYRKRTRPQPNKPIVGQKLNRQNENQGFEKTSAAEQAQADLHYNPDIYRVQSGDKYRKPGHRLPEYGDINNIQTFEDGPIPTGSAKSITQEVYRPNDLRITNIQRQAEAQTKLQPKVDASSGSLKTFDVPRPTVFLEDSEVNPTALYVETTASRTGTYDHPTLTPKSESNENVIPTTLSPSLYKSETYAPEQSSASFERHPTTENALQDDRFTVAFAEISKHYHIPSPPETVRRYEAKYTDVQPTSAISHALQPPPFAESLSQEQQPQGLATLEEAKPTYSLTDSENINVPTTISNEGFSGLFNNENDNKQNFSASVNEVKPTVSASFSNQQHSTEYTAKYQPTLGFVADTEQPVSGFANVENFQSTPSSPTSPLEQYYLTSARVHGQDYGIETKKSKNEENYYPATFETIRVSADVPTTPSYGQEVVSHSEKLSNDNLAKVEDYSQTSGDVSSTTEGLRFSNPSIVKVRTRVRGRQRGSVNYATSQSSTSAPALRNKFKNQFEESDQEYEAKPNGLRNYNPVKTQKFNGFRGLKKPVATTTHFAQTVEPTTEYDQKANVYTIRPQRRPSNPSTVSTKRIRRPTSPIPTLETSTEGFGFSSSAVYSHGGIDNQEYPSSGVSNDVYYEHANISPIRQKLFKTQNVYDRAELKTVSVPTYSSTTSLPSPTPETSFPSSQEVYSQNGEIISELTHEQPSQPTSEKYFVDSNLSESGIDISGIVLTTLRTTAEEESSEETETLKKSQESKKAIDPDLEKKNGRRRIRVRVHKRPHENFETAESQNLRTVANVLVPPTSTYKPNDENSFQQLSKNSQASYGVRSREYFKKKLNLTHLADIDVVAKSRDDSTDGKSNNENSSGEAQGERTVEEHRVRVGYFGKGQRKGIEFGGDHSADNVPSGPGGEKFSRTKVRGFVRKIKKHGVSHKNATTPATASDDDDGEVREENVESHSRQQVKINYGGSHQNGRFNGTRHRTIVKYIKKNRFRTHEEETPEPEIEKGEEEHKVTESQTSSQANEDQVHETDVHTTQQTATQNVEKEFQTTLKDVEEDAISTTLRNESVNSQETESDVAETPATTEQSKATESSENQQETTQNTEESSVQSTEQYGLLHTQRSDTIQAKVQTTEQPQQFDTEQTEAAYIPTTENYENEKLSESEDSSKTSEESHEAETEANSSTSSKQTTGLRITNKPKPFHSFRPFYQRTPSSGFIRTREPLSTSTTEHFKPEPNERRFGFNRHKYEKSSSRKEEKSEEKKIVEQADRHVGIKNSFTPEIRKYSRSKNRENSFSSFSKSRYTTPGKLVTSSEASEEYEDESREKQTETTSPEIEKTTKNEPEFDVSTKVEHTSSDAAETTLTFAASTEPLETTNDDHTVELRFTTTAPSTEAETREEGDEEHKEKNEKETTSEEETISTEGKSEPPTTSIQTTSPEGKVITTESATEIPTTTDKAEVHSFETQPNLYVFGKDTFSFDEAEKFTGTKNRAYVRNITADILENTAHFSAPGIDKQNEIEIQSESISGDVPTTTDFSNRIAGEEGDEKTEGETATELTSVETTTSPPSTSQAISSQAVTKAKIAKLVKTSTTTKISHETEICYRGKCIRTKSENPDDDLKLLVDSANVSLEKNKT